jgi:hypothetical protein
MPSQELPNPAKTRAVPAAQQPRRPVAQLSGILLAPLLAGLISATPLVHADNAFGRTTARAARTLNVTDTAHLHNVKSPGSSLLIDEGAATGTVPGTVRIGFNVGATVEANFTIYAHGWSLVGHGSGALHNSKSRSDVYASFSGTMTVSHGTGRYAHAHGQGGFYGVINRETYAVTIQTTGTLNY